MQRIDIMNKADVGHIVKLVDRTPGKEMELTVAALSSTTNTLPDVDVHLMPVPDEDPETTLHHALTALEDVADVNHYVRIDADDITTVFKDALMVVIHRKGDSPTAIDMALDADLSGMNIPANAITGAVLSITCPVHTTLSEVASITQSVRRDIGDTTIIWGLNLGDTDIFRVTILLAVSRER